MQTDTAKLGELKLKEDEDVMLYSTDGNVISIAEFVQKNIGVLTSLEQRIVREQIDGLASSIPEHLTVPLLRTQKYANSDLEIQAKRAGARSAYIQDLGLKVKGCRPENTTFPEWGIDDEFNVRVDEVPFGVLTKEGVMREILAYCFMRKYHLPYSAEPVAVFEYKPQGRPMNFALVASVGDDTRLESLIDCHGYSVGDIIKLKKEGRLGVEPDVWLGNVDLVDYPVRKAELLAKFNFNGGFRGILNSNIGNDVVRDDELFSICDFDTFRVVPIPQKNDKEGIRNFIIHCYTELIKSSTPFVDYIEFTDETKEQIHGTLADYYRQHSYLCQAYNCKVRYQARIRGWDSAHVETCINDAFKTAVSFELLQELIPNSFTLRNFKAESYYVPHN